MSSKHVIYLDAFSASFPFLWCLLIHKDDRNCSYLMPLGFELWTPGVMSDCSCNVATISTLTTLIGSLQLPSTKMFNW